MYRWKGSYSEKQLLAWDVYEGNNLVAYAMQRLDGKWKLRINPNISNSLDRYLILDDDPNIFMPHLLITLVATQRDE